MDKKTRQLAAHVSDDVERQIRGLADLEGMSTSEYLREKVILEHLLCKRREFNLMLEVFGGESSLRTDSSLGTE